MNTMWEEFGFAGNPYSHKPLPATATGLRLFQERKREEAMFLTQMDSEDGCVVVVSGDAGIGKTSFVNIQQHIMSTGRSGFDPKLLPDLEITPIMEGESPTTLARRLVQNTVLNIQNYCSKHGKKIPSQTSKVGKWLSHEGFTSSYSMSFSGTGFSRTQVLPPVANASLETWYAVMRTIASEAKVLGLDGVVACLDNAETLTKDELTKLLMAYRDTLFASNGVWWIIIGQSGLYSHIDALDRRVSQRIKGRGVEIPPFTASEFHDLIEKRVQEFRKNPNALSPLKQSIHEMLFEASCGELRFVLDTADSLVGDIITMVRENASDSLKNVAAPEEISRVLTSALRKILIDGQIPDKLARNILMQTAFDFAKRYRLTKFEVDTLNSIGGRTVTSAEFTKYSFETMDKFDGNFLEPLRKKNILAREDNGGMFSYRLKGFIKLCKEFGTLDKLA